ncbi:YeeE/YedE family protein, partial [Escherichia coli]|nr:YeeE/YedE family protein [Escherichia coli]
MPDIDLNVLSHTVLWGTFVLTFVFGAILQRTHFCTMGAVSD